MAKSKKFTKCDFSYMVYSENGELRDEAAVITTKEDIENIPKECRDEEDVAILCTDCYEYLLYNSKKEKYTCPKCGVTYKRFDPYMLIQEPLEEFDRRDYEGIFNQFWPPMAPDLYEDENSILYIWDEERELYVRYC